VDVIRHNGTPIIPAALAVGEQLKASWGKVAGRNHRRLRGAFAALGDGATCPLVSRLPGSRHVRHLRRRSGRRQAGWPRPAMKHALGVAGAIMPVEQR
jgi:hypothetical protein